MNQQLKKGIIELIILQLLSTKEYYGYELSQYINKHISFKESSIYIILSRLEQHNYLTSRKDKSKINNKTVKYYKINQKGTVYLKEMTEEFEKINDLICIVKEEGEKNE